MFHARPLWYQILLKNQFLEYCWWSMAWCVVQSTEIDTNCIVYKYQPHPVDSLAHQICCKPPISGSLKKMWYTTISKWPANLLRAVSKIRMFQWKIPFKVFRKCSAKLIIIIHSTNSIWKLTIVTAIDAIVHKRFKTKINR